jgi:hypothetical protein
MNSPNELRRRSTRASRQPLHFTWSRLLLPTAVGLLIALFGLVRPEPSAGQGKTPPTDEEIAKRLGLTVQQIQLLRTQRAMTNEMLATFPVEDVSMLLRKLARINIQRQRSEFHALSLRNEDGDILDGSKVKAIEQWRAMHAQTKKGFKAGLPVGPDVLPAKLLPPPPAAPAPDQPAPTVGWQTLGPTTIGGRTRALVVDPQNPNIMYAGAAAGGVWKTINAGKSWYPLDDMLALMGVCSLVLDPTNPDIIYAGTGEGWNNTDYVRGNGIYKSIDGGAHWTWLQVPPQKPSWQYVDRLAISNNGQVLVAVVGMGDTTRKTIAPDAGIWISSDAAHSQWNLILNGYISCVLVDPKNNSNVLASAMAYSPKQGDAYYSVNGGINWTQVPQSQNWYGRVEMSYARADSSIVYASVGQNGGGEIWRSTDGGHTFTKMAGKTAAGETVAFLGTQDWYANTIWAGDPTNPNFIIVGGLDLWKSTDGGNTLVSISNWNNAPISCHADQHAIVSHAQYDGTKNKTVYFCNDGGIYCAEDVTTVGSDAYRTQGWIQLNNNYVVTQFYGIAVDAKNGVIIGGLQDNGTHRLTINENKLEWSTVWGGDGGNSVIDPDDPTFAYGSYTRLDLFNITKAGVRGDWICGYVYDATAKKWVRRPAPYNIPDAANPYDGSQPYKTNFIAPVVLDPNNHNRLLAGGASLWVTDDVRTVGTQTTGPKWTELKPALPGDPNYISAIAVAKGDSNVIWIGHNGSNIYVTRNGLAANPQWTRVDLSLPSRMVTRIVIDPANHEHAYVTFGGYSTGNVWETVNGGTNWRDISLGLPAAPYRTLTVHPRNPNLLYLGGEVGLFASDNNGGTWTPTNEGPTGCRVDDIVWMDEYLVAATHGRGIFRYNLASTFK